MSPGPTLYSRLPPLYHGKLAGIFGEDYPVERFATCATCVSCQSAQSPYLSTKCCTYQPSLPNFLVGGVLADTSVAAGRARLETLIAAADGVTPYGVLKPAARPSMPPPIASGPIPTRAEAEAMRCTFFDQGTCTIWAYREHLCSTFFCYSVGGHTGRAFWRLVDDYLMLAERELCLYALAELGWPAEALVITDPLIDRQPAAGSTPAERRARLWGEWMGREVELYLECYRIVGGLSQDATRTILGWKGERLERALETTLPRFRRDNAPELITAILPIRFADSDDTQVIVTGAQGATVRLPRLVALFLAQFDGERSTSEIVRLAASLDIDVANHLVPLLAAGVLRQAR